jgi:8-oxo-dGTP pyrophosphatase MutT (NUDIX family)
MKAGMQLLWRLKWGVLKLLRWKTKGVKVMLFNPAGELLLIRNTYGRSHLFVFPGGGIKRRETPFAAALREIREEVGIACEQLRFVSVHRNEGEGKRDTIHLFAAVTAATPVADGVEVEEARFFALDVLPENVSAATLRRIAEYRGERPAAGDW